MTASPAAARSETADRYLEAIYYIEHEGEVARPGRLAEWLGVSAPTVTVTLQRLARDGWVKIAGDRSVDLTAPGAEAAAAIVRRHRIVERWLTDVLGLDWATADREAASLAPGISPTVLDRLDEHLGHPSTCPHGNLIPGRRPPKGSSLVRLTELDPGAAARVARISEVAEHEAPQLLATLDRHGLLPGVELRVVERQGSTQTVRVGSDSAVLDAGIARAIWVVPSS
jgi:DtxR family transcriptional regulator, Mn-dependent transcriptional regulator